MNFLDGLSKATTASVLTRFLANVFAFMLLASALAVGTVELLAGQPINSYVLLILGAGLGYVLNVLGINQGVTLQPLTAEGGKDGKPPGLSNGQPT